MVPLSVTEPRVAATQGGNVSKGLCPPFFSETTLQCVCVCERERERERERDRQRETERETETETETDRQTDRLRDRQRQRETDMRQRQREKRREREGENNKPLNTIPPSESTCSFFTASFCPRFHCSFHPLLSQFLRS